MCWDCYENPKGDPYKIFTQGGVDIDDFDEVIKYRHPPRKKKAVKKKRGCPENDYKAHVYVWQHFAEPYRSWNGQMRVFEYDAYICCGCEHIKNKKYNWLAF